jgi:hypothetical protein
MNRAHGYRSVIALRRCDAQPVRFAIGVAYARDAFLL